MRRDLLTLTQSYFTPYALERLSGALGEALSTTERAVEGGVPALLGAIVERGSTAAGARGIFDLIRQGGYDNADVWLLTDQMGDGSPQALARRRGLLDSLLGDKEGDVVRAVSNESGMRPSSVASLLGMCAPVVLGVLGKETAARGDSASGLYGILTNSRPGLSRFLPPGAAEGGRASGESVRGAAASGRRAGRQGLGAPSIAVLGLLALGACLLFLFRPGTADRAGRQAQEEVTAARDAARQTVNETVDAGREAAQRGAEAVADGAKAVGDLASRAASEVSTSGRPGGEGAGAPAQPASAIVLLPDGAKIDAPPGSVGYDLTTFFASDDGAAPKAFVLDRLNFETGSTELMAGSKGTLETVAAVLKAYPDASVRIEGYADDGGNPESDRLLSDARARAVKGELTAMGVAANRVSSAGHGPARPGDADGGRAESRRVELIVLKK